MKKTLIAAFSMPCPTSSTTDSWTSTVTRQRGTLKGRSHACVTFTRNRMCHHHFVLPNLRLLPLNHIFVSCSMYDFYMYGSFQATIQTECDFVCNMLSFSVHMKFLIHSNEAAANTFQTLTDAFLATADFGGSDVGHVGFTKNVFLLFVVLLPIS